MCLRGRPTGVARGSGMVRHSIGKKPRRVLKFDALKTRRGIANGAQRASEHKKAVVPRLDRLEAENAELRAKAIDLILQIQVLRDGNPAKRPRLQAPDGS
jgi:hypothetical protein